MTSTITVARHRYLSLADADTVSSGNQASKSAINNDNDGERAKTGSSRYKKERAVEVVDVIFAYTDMALWSTAMYVY